MPFCTACGHQNPDDARFCAQCGTRVAGAAEPSNDPTPQAAGSGEGDGETTATITLGSTGSHAAPGAGPSAEAKNDTSDKLRPVDAAAVDALPPGHALLVVQKGPSSGSRFLLDSDKVEAGRHPDSDIFLDDVTVSRRHAVFHREQGSFTVADVGSLNGTYVNRDRIEQVRLGDGDEVQIGKYRLVFFSGHDRG